MPSQIPPPRDIGNDSLKSTRIACLLKNSSHPVFHPTSFKNFDKSGRMMMQKRGEKMKVGY
jgi:hypothetical protein